MGTEDKFGSISIMSWQDGSKSSLEECTHEGLILKESFAQPVCVHVILAIDHCATTQGQSIAPSSSGQACLFAPWQREAQREGEEGDQHFVDRSPPISNVRGENHSAEITIQRPLGCKSMSRRQVKSCFVSELHAHADELDALAEALELSAVVGLSGASRGWRQVCLRWLAIWDSVELPVAWRDVSVVRREQERLGLLVSWREQRRLDSGAQYPYGKVVTIQALRYIARRCPRLRSLNLDCSHTSVVDLSPVTLECLSLRELRLRQDWWTQLAQAQTPRAIDLRSVACALPQLRVCAIDGHFTNDAIAGLAEHCSELIQVELTAKPTRHRFNQQGPSLPQALTSLAESCNRLQHLELGGSGWEDSREDGWFRHAFPNLLQLSVDSLSEHFNPLSNAALKHVFDGCPHLQRFDANIQKITTLRDCCPSLRRLTLRGGDQLTTAAVSALTQSCPLVQHLEIPGHPKIKSFQGTANLEYLNVSKCGLTDAGLEAVLGSSPVLTTLHIGGNNAVTVLQAGRSLERITASCCSQLTRLEGHFERLRMLDVADCHKLESLRNCIMDRLEFANITGCKALDALPLSCPRLRELNAESCKLTEALASESPCLESLKLSGATVPEGALDAFLNGCDRLLHLDLYGTRLTDAMLSTVARHCHRLRHLILGASRHLGAPGIRVIGMAFPQLETVNLDADGRQIAAVTELAQRRPHLRSGISHFPGYFFDQPINLRVVTQDGNEFFYKCSPPIPLSKLMHAFCQRQGVARRSVRFLYDGTHLHKHQRPIDLDMEDGDVIDVMVEQGCIAAPVPATFGVHKGTPGCNLLLQPEALASATPDDAARLARGLGGAAALECTAAPSCYPEAQLLDSSERADLIAWLDAQHVAASQAEDDLRRTMSNLELATLIGAGAVERLLAFFGGPCDTIKLRRVAASGHCIAFHTDFSRRTMQVALNGDDEYDGGRLLFATASGFEQPRRPAGSATIHTRSVVHGVTALRSGTRYSLFLCDTRQSAAATSAAWTGTAVTEPTATTAAPAMPIALGAVDASRDLCSLPAPSSNSRLGLGFLHAAVAAQFAFFESAVLLLDAASDNKLAELAGEYLVLLPAMTACQFQELQCGPTAQASGARGNAKGVAAQDGADAQASTNFGVELMWRTHMLSPLRYLQACACPTASSWKALDLVSAVRRQHGSMRRMLDLKPQLADPQVVDAAICDYGHFLVGQRGSESQHVPTLSTDLVWHAHMCMCPTRYGDDCHRLAGHFVDHDDNDMLLEPVAN